MHLSNTIIVTVLQIENNQNQFPIASTHLLLWLYLLTRNFNHQTENGAFTSEALS